MISEASRRVYNGRRVSFVILLPSRSISIVLPLQFEVVVMEPAGDSAEAKWMAASDALNIMTRDGENPVDIQAMLAEYLRAGTLRARVSSVWTTTEKSLATAWKGLSSDSPVEHDIEVPVRYWRSDRRALDDRARWRWPVNKFFYTIAGKPLKRRMFAGVHFNTDDLAKLQPQYFTSVRKPRRGRKTDVSARDRGWLVVVTLSQDGLLHADKFKSQSELEVEMQDRLKLSNGMLALGQGQIREIASMVIKILKPQHVAISE